jgi:hypothetical protein
MLNLAITFRGPFVFAVCDDGVDVYAPRCEGHTAGVFTARKEFPLYGLYKSGYRYTYKVSAPGISANPKDIVYLPPSTSSDGAFLDAPLDCDINPQLVHFHIALPKPVIMYGLNTTTAAVVGAPSTQILDWATGARLYYECDLSKPITLTPPFGSAVDITPPSGADSGTALLPNFGDIDFEYRGPNVSDDDHNDAMTCFANIAQLVGLDWWLQYDQDYTGAHVRTGGDCQAVPLLMGRVGSGGKGITGILQL